MPSSKSIHQRSLSSGDGSRANRTNVNALESGYDNESTAYAGSTNYRSNGNPRANNSTAYSMGAATATLLSHHRGSEGNTNRYSGNQRSFESLGSQQHRRGNSSSSSSSDSDSDDRLRTATDPIHPLQSRANQTSRSTTSLLEMGASSAQRRQRFYAHGRGGSTSSMQADAVAQHNASTQSASFNAGAPKQSASFNSMGRGGLARRGGTGGFENGHEHSASNTGRNSPSQSRGGATASAIYSTGRACLQNEYTGYGKAESSSEENEIGSATRSATVG